MARESATAQNKLRQLAQILDSHDVFGVSNRINEINKFMTNMGHLSKNTYNTISFVCRTNNVRISAITLRTNGELGIVEIKADAHIKGSPDIDYMNLNRQLSESLRLS